MSDLWKVVIIVAVAGAIGGFLNAISTDNSFALPRAVKDGASTVAYRIGVLGNMLTSAIAATVSWGLYGPSTGSLLVGKAADGTTPPEPTLTIGTVWESTKGAERSPRKVQRRSRSAEHSSALPG
jgi:hypothetical protein